jgi:hypothetical protein
MPVPPHRLPYVPSATSAADGRGGFRDRHQHAAMTVEDQLVALTVHGSPFCEIDPGRMPYRFEAQSIFLSLSEISEMSHFQKT